ncbi:hypothetical protein PAERUG_E6_London_17_VIM_2_12_12_00728 [Pseudomonas aeruginosa]|nr:hypothetical protein PAERUG_P18_London_17_VIM_2_04_10_01515 [Pseudomonas aeruginosa]CRO88980.1 hypothetical protein PAERUG_E6_London_17_VIM_2_12_12_00728 [Pseudomonas aeruginosa]CRQ56845.1 hypothetical protein PAERUG_P2_London_28_IMP_1_06_05_06142 [Pseudomonas aeruginosa]CRQ83331.1 hypothetical protein PAERUG_E16_London_17_VIM_2_04_14_02834 [Pseudomonas aeruginosa]SST11867.1 Uncharacterised protein [Acinetobacter baumannii]
MPGAAEEGVGDHRRAVDVELVGAALVAAGGQLVELLEDRAWDEGEGLVTVGIETVQHAVVGADVYPRGTGFLCFCERGVVAAGLDRLGQVGQVLGLADRRRRGVDDIAEDRVAGAEVVAVLLAAIATQEGHSVLALGVGDIVAVRIAVQLPLLVGAEAAPGELLEARGTGSGHHDLAASSTVGHRVEDTLRAPQLGLHGGLVLGGQAVAGQVASPVLVAGEAGLVGEAGQLVASVVFLQGRADGGAGCRQVLARNSVEDVLEGRDQLVRRVGAEELAPGVHCGVPQVIDVVAMVIRSVRPAEAPGGDFVIAAGVGGTLPLRAGEAGGQAQAQGIGHHVLPGRRIVARIPVLRRGIGLVRVGNVRLDIVVDIRPGIGGPVMEGLVGQGIGRSIPVRRLAAVALAIGEATTRAVGIAYAGRVVVPKTIGHQNVIAATAAVFRRGLGTRSIGIGAVDAGLLEKLPCSSHGLTQRSTTSDRQVLQPVEEVHPMLPGEVSQVVVVTVTGATADQARGTVQ